MIKKILKIFAYVIVIFCLVVIGIFGFTQSKFFKERLRVIIVSELSQSLKSEFYLGTIRGNFITGFSIDSLSIYSENEKFLSLKGIKLSHDPFTIVGKKITLTKLSIDNIDVNIIRSSDSIWNVKKIFRPSSQESKPLTWTIDIKDFKISSGRFSVYDSVKSIFVNPKDSLTKYLDYRHFSVQDLKLHLSAQIKDKDYKLKIKNLQFYVPSINFNLVSLATEIKLNSKNIEVNNLLIETDNTSLKVDASLKDLNLFEKITLTEFESKPVKLKLLSNKFDLNEFKKFLPAVYFLNGSVYADIDAAGEFGSIKVNQINLKTFNSFLQLSGDIVNLHNPKNLFLNIRVFDSQIIPADVNKLLPAFKIPAFQHVKSVFLNASYQGTPLNFKSKINLTSDKLGKASVDLTMNLQDTLIKYKAAFETKDLDLYLLTESKLLSSKLNTTGFIEGEGTKLYNLNSKLSLRIDTSIVNEIYYKNINLDLTTKDKTIDAELKINSNAGMLDLNSKFSFIQSENPEYKIAANFSNLNIGRIIADNQWLSDLNFDVNTSIEGKDLDKLNGFFDINLFPSTIADKKLDAETINLKLDQISADDRKLSVNSKMFEFGLNGNFSLKSSFKYFDDVIKNIRTEIDKRLGKYDLARATYNDKESKIETSDFDFSYYFKASNINFISKLFLSTPFNFNGEISGNVKYSQGYLTGKTNIKINDYFVGTETKGILISNANLNLLLDTLSDANILEKSKFKLKFSAEQINFSKIKFFENDLNIDYANSTGLITLKNRYENEFFLNTEALLSTKYNYFLFDITQFIMNLKNYSIAADTVIKLVINDNGLQVENMSFVSSSGEKLYFSGSLDKENNLKFITRIDRLLVENLKLFTEKKSAVEKLKGTAFLMIEVNGTLEEPNFNSRILIDSIMYKNSSFGKLNALLNYKDKKLNLSISAVNPAKDNETMFSVFGFLPVDLSLSGVKTRFPDENVSVKVKTNGLSLEILNPLIPFIDNLSGVVVCDLQVGGTTMNPDYYGNINFNNVRFLLLSNYVHYNLSGSLIADNDKIFFSDFNIKNDKSDFDDGVVNLSGYFAIKEYTFESFDLNAKGQLLLLKEGVRRKMQNIYGKLIAKTEEEGISFKGNIQSSNISGTIVIKEANLVFPPSQTHSYIETDNLIKYVAVNDTILIPQKKDIKTEFYYSENDKSSTYWMEETPTSSKFLNGLTYDLVLYTKGTTNIRMIFNPATNEELYAELDGRINIQRFSNKNYFIGEILISERSYYNFFKRFEASGKLKFIGDPNNPELEIKATYTGNRTVPASPQDTSVIEQKVVIGLDITGTRNEPKLAMSIKIDDKDYNDVIQSGDLQSDAISFLFTSKFRDDLTTREKSDIISGIGTTAGKSLIAGATSTMLSGILTDFLRREFGFIRSAEVTYAGGNLQQSADLRLSGQIFNAYWRFGGRIFDDINNANVSFILNFGDVFESPKIKNFYLELERRVDGREYGLDKKLTNSAKIYYKWSF
ncbi:MAG: hypothetical protein IGBAC_0900 [Ignavibacteriae bacterium]|nr:MAG: hypothetical protein IGBAC_0900 [Ignavibacteriota bacterium]